MTESEEDLLLRQHIEVLKLFNYIAQLQLLRFEMPAKYLPEIDATLEDLRLVSKQAY